MTLLSAFMLLFLVMDPAGNIPLFIATLAPVEPSRRRKVARRRGGSISNSWRRWSMPMPPSRRVRRCCTRGGTTTPSSRWISRAAMWRRRRPRPRSISSAPTK
ncbi:MAG: hypothetical protein IIB09_04760 [Bacteroidetes bacterium]|nr:hypothetical protein [Bacteroidota bacterium]